MTVHSSDAGPTAASSSPAARHDEGTPRRPWLAAIIVAAIVIVAIGVVGGFVVSGGDDQGWQTVDIGEQGQFESAMAEGGARFQRRPDGITVEVTMPTPEPGTYEYPTGDMVPPSAAPHPAISPGAGEAPEAFTLWLFAFNDPSQCTDGQCDTDDFAPGAAARGGVYQVDGRVGDGDELRFGGNIRLGQQPIDGAPLDHPERAEVHIAIAPHGRVLPGEDGWRQLNGPVGNPTLWWGASSSLQQ